MLGIAFWDSRRLIGLKLLGPSKEDGFTRRQNTSENYSVMELMYIWILIADGRNELNER